MSKRIPRKPGQPAGSDKHSDLYTDENPKGTIHGLKFATKEDAEKSVNKIKNSGRSHAHKIQAAIAMEQRARVMGKTSAAAVYRKFINAMKKKTKEKNENVRSADKKPEVYTRPDGKRGVRMVPTDREVVKKEAYNAAQQAAIAINMKRKGKKPKNEDAPANSTGVIPDPKTTVMGPSFTTTNVMDRRKKKKPDVLKRYQINNQVERFKSYMETELLEDNVEKIRDIVKRKQFGKIKLKDGMAMIDLFTASAITNAIDKRLSAKNVEKVKDMLNNGTKNQLMKLVQVVMGGNRAV